MYEKWNGQHQTVEIELNGMPYNLLGFLFSHRNVCSFFRPFPSPPSLSTLPSSVCTLFLQHYFVRVQKMRSSEKQFWQQRLVHVFARHKSMLSAHCTFSPKNWKLKRAAKFESNKYHQSCTHTHTHTSSQMHEANTQKNTVRQNKWSLQWACFQRCSVWYDTQSFRTLVAVIGFKSGTIIATCTCLWMSWAKRMNEKWSRVRTGACTQHKQTQRRA